MIWVHIDRLTLDGAPLGPGGADRLRAAMEEHLAGAIAGAALAPELAGGGALPTVAAPGVIVLDAASPGRTGRRLATSVAGAITTPVAGGRR